MVGADPGFGGAPDKVGVDAGAIAFVAQRGGGDEEAVGVAGEREDKGERWVEPVAAKGAVADGAGARGAFPRFEAEEVAVVAGSMAGQASRRMMARRRMVPVMASIRARVAPSRVSASSSRRASRRLTRVVSGMRRRSRARSSSAPINRGSSCKNRSCSLSTSSCPWRKPRSSGGCSNKTVRQISNREAIPTMWTGMALSVLTPSLLPNLFKA